MYIQTKNSIKSALIALLLLAASCAPKQNNSENSFQIIRIDPASNRGILLSSIIENIEVIALETNENGLIGDLDKLRFYKGRFYTLEQFGNQKLLCFSEAGEFLHQIGGVGKGVGEYITPRDMNINPYHKRLELYDILNNKILYYSIDGDYLGYYSAPRKSRAFTILDSLHYGFFNDGAYDDLPFNFFVAPTDSFRVMYHSIPFLGERDVMNGKNLLFESAANTYFAYSLNDTIYSVTPKGPKPKYVLDYDAEKIPEDIIKKDMFAIVAYLEGKQVPSFISNLIENSLFFSASYNYDDYGYNTFFLSRETGKVVNLYQPVNDLNYIPFHPPICIMNNKFVSATPAHEIVIAYQELSEKMKSNPESVNAKAFSELKKIASKIKEDDNPVLLVYSLIRF
jgi:hypothetical protein